VVGAAYDPLAGSDKLVIELEIPAVLPA